MRKVGRWVAGLVAVAAVVGGAAVEPPARAEVAEWPFGPVAAESMYEDGPRVVVGDGGAEREQDGGVCQEDDPCWNPCTMGLNGQYPEGDPRREVPGPCFLGTPLPYGHSFAVQVTPLPVPGAMSCPDGPDSWGFAQVTVSVRDAAGRTVAGASRSATGCVWALDAPPVDGAGDPRFGELFREVADALD